MAQLYFKYGAMGSSKTANALINYLMNTAIPNPCEFTSHKEIQPHTTLCPGRFFPLDQMHERFG